MINLFNIDIDTIKFNGNEIMFMKLDNDIIFSNITAGGIYNSYRIGYNTNDDTKTISLTKKSCNTSYNLITDWGDGTIDNENTHTYTEYGFYTIVTNGFIDLKSEPVYISSVNYIRPDIIDGSHLFYNFDDVNYDRFYFPETSYMTDMSYMFYNCKGLEDTLASEAIDLNSFNTSNVTNMNHMFYGCNNICNLEINNWDTRKVTDMSYMFYDCFDRAASSLDLSNWNTSKVTNMDSMFRACNNLGSLDISNFDLTKVTNTDNMLAGSLLDSFSKLRLDNCDRNTIEKIITSEGFPTKDYGSREIYVRSDQVEGLIAPEGWTFVDVTPYKVGDFANNTEITEVTTTVNKTCTNLSSMFNGCTALTTANTTDWDTSNVTTMSFMFSGCESLTYLDLSNFDTSQVTNMNMMFYDCWNLGTLDLRNFDMSNVETASNMLRYCNSLHTLHLDNCSNDTIRKIVTSSSKANFPSGSPLGGEYDERILYCKKENADGIEDLLPSGWYIMYVKSYT